MVYRKPLWVNIKDWRIKEGVPVLLWGGVIRAEHTGSEYPYTTPVKAYWDGESWQLSDCVYHGGEILNPVKVRTFPKPPKGE